MIVRVRVHGAWQRLTPVAQRREEKPAGEGTYVVPRRIRGQGGAPEAGATGGIDLAEATADGLKIALIPAFEDSALREPFGDAAEELDLFNDGLRIKLTLADPDKLILGAGCEEGHPTQRPGTHVHVAEMVHTCMIALGSRRIVFDGKEGGQWPARCPRR
ncbi:hypothetical protein ACFYXH_36550 [Streptomyces sp. NPDC002730]|uniref:hypothetical protein n=1 Tax=Streptomyces sp. NPDC002730 TaxID=3364662 RepID=UPI00367F304F